MRIQTNSAITINDGLSGTRSTKITGEIIRLISEPNGDKKIVYKYEDDNGAQLPTKENPKLIPASSVQALYDGVKAGLPSDSDYNDREWNLYYEVFKVEMVDTFADLTATSQISTITGSTV